MNEVTFNITVTMNKRWVSHFLSFLKRMEFDVVWTNKKGQLKEFNEKMHIFDAG